MRFAAGIMNGMMEEAIRIGLKGEQIPISAQIVSLADVYDALVSDRIYKKAYSHKEAVRMILAGECGAFNPLLLECLEEIQGKIKEELEVQDVPEISPVPVQCPDFRNIRIIHARRQKVRNVK
ncbi:MAG: HD-GYP domain-containing protein [Anaerobutyricum hallii]